jgi:hypothetical protein
MPSLPFEGFSRTYTDLMINATQKNAGEFLPQFADPSFCQLLQHLRRDRQGG